jgi:hypothetical protein
MHNKASANDTVFIDGAGPSLDAGMDFGSATVNIVPVPRAALAGLLLLGIATAGRWIVHRKSEQKARVPAGPRNRCPEASLKHRSPVRLTAVVSS